ncbi:MAG TPA: hypothetical protein VGK53_14190 [Propionicimonas sp.]
MLGLDEQRTTWRRNHVAAVDAFLLTGAAGVLLLVLLSLFFVEPSVWSEVLSQLVLVGSVLGGTALAWRLHGHRLTRATWVSLVLCAIGGAIVAVPVFLALVTLGRLVPLPADYPEGPWGAVLIVTLVVVAFLAGPVVGSIREFGSGSAGRTIAGLRLGALAVIIAVIIVTISIGGELAEAAMFMAPVAAASAAAIVGVAAVDKWRASHNSPRPG